LLRAWSGALFAAGVYGAWSFPWAAPLAILSRPLSAGELKHCARALREQSLAGSNDGKIKTGPAACAAFPAGCFGAAEGSAALFGPVFDIAVPSGLFPARVSGKIIRRFSPPVLGSALVWGSAPAQNALPGPPELSFRAAALANMIFRPLGAGDGGGDISIGGADTQIGDCSFEWKIGKLYWLPPVRSGKRPAPPAEGKE
jgi:hypothetical protein